MKGYWTYGDLIDLEYFLDVDRETLQADLHHRDRQIFLDFSEEDQEDTVDSLIRRWLFCRRSQVFPAGKSPGHGVTEAFKTFSIIVMLCSGILGLTGGLGFFTYSGTTPVNVINFLFLFVFSQLLMLLFLFAGAGLRLAGAHIFPAPVTGLYASSVAWFLNRSKKLSHYLPSTSSGRISQFEAVLKKQRVLHGPVFYWPLFSLSQRAMVCFNGGLLAATCFRILTSDIAFGWQSTIQFSTDFIARTVRTLALPWSWIVPHQYGYPSAAQIEGSRIILKDGIYHLQTQDLVSWWPFLVLCILFYGIIVRLLLVAAGKAGQWRALRNLKTDRPAVVQLVNRMKTPLVKSQAAGSEQSSAAEQRPDPESSYSMKPGSTSSELLLLFSDDISDNYASSVWEQHLISSGFSVSDCEIYRQSPEANHDLFERLRSESGSGSEGIMLVMESWMPPINETLDLIRALRSTFGEKQAIYVGLVGEGSDRHTIYRPDPVERKIWRQKLDTLADPYLSLIDIGIQHQDGT